MSFPHAPRTHSAVSYKSSQPGTPVRADARPMRSTSLTRRYEVSWLDRDGLVQSSTRLAPATPQFEEACSAFARGTLIATDRGMVAVEDLEPGMAVQTAEGCSEQVVWIGSMMIYPAHSLPGIEPAMLTRITAEAFGTGRPMPDLMLGPQARILFRDLRCRLVTGAEAAFAPARAFVDGDSIISVTPAATIMVYHVMLRRHSPIRTAGIEVESFHPGQGFGEIIDPQLAGLFLSLFPNVTGFADFGPLSHIRLSTAEAERVLYA